MMENYDIFIVVVLLITTLFGAWKGMAWQLASLASFVVSYFAALQFSGPLAPLFGDKAPWNKFLAMLVIYLATSAAIWIAFRVVSGMIDRVKLKEFDRQIGALFGLAKGVLLSLIITFFVVTLSGSEVARQAVFQSQSGYYMALILDHADGIMPEEIHDAVGPYLHDFERELDPTSQPHGIPREPLDTASEGDPDPV